MMAEEGQPAALATVAADDIDTAAKGTLPGRKIVWCGLDPHGHKHVLGVGRPLGVAYGHLIDVKEIVVRRHFVEVCGGSDERQVGVTLLGCSGVGPHGIDASGQVGANVVGRITEQLAVGADLADAPIHFAQQVATVFSQSRPLGVDNADFFRRGIKEDFTFGRMPDGKGAGMGVVEGVFGQET